MSPPIVHNQTPGKSIKKQRFLGSFEAKSRNAYSNFLHKISSFRNQTLFFLNLSKLFGQTSSLDLDIYLQIHKTHSENFPKEWTKKTNNTIVFDLILTFPADTLLSVLISSIRVSMSGVRSIHCIACCTIDCTACKPRYPSTQISRNNSVSVLIVNLKET